MTSGPTKYQQSREQSAEIMRQVLSLMAQHDAAFNPVNYAIWYEHAAGLNNRLSVALQEALKTEPRLSDATLFRLHQEFMVEPDALAMQQVSQQLQRAISGVKGQAERTGEQAGVYEGQLNLLVRNIRNGSPLAAQSLLNRIVKDTTQMGDSARELSSEVAICRLEIDRLSTELVRALDEALIDPLTGILNRKGFDQKLAEMFKTPARSGEAHCLVLLDIDLFKRVNDTYGHVMGDRVIQAVGEMLTTGLTQVATHSVARYGGEEFAILLPNASITIAAQVAEAVRQRTKGIKIRDRRANNLGISITISGGVAALRAGDDVKSFIDRADRALYQAKVAGRDRISGY
jgi:diguanylate cyclase